MRVCQATCAFLALEGKGVGPGLNPGWVDRSTLGCGYAGDAQANQLPERTHTQTPLLEQSIAVVAKGRLGPGWHSKGQEFGSPYSHQKTC